MLKTYRGSLSFSNLEFEEWEELKIYSEEILKNVEFYRHFMSSF